MVNKMKGMKFQLVFLGCLLSGCSFGTGQETKNNVDEEVIAQRIEENLSREFDSKIEAQMKEKLAAMPNAPVKGGDDGGVKALPVYAPDAARSSGSGSKRKATERRFRLEDEQNTVDVFEQTAPATVYVTQNRVVQTNWFGGGMEVPAGTGSGFIWDKSGHIVTNYHVVAGGSTLTVTLYNQKTYPARLVGVEPRKDIAVLKIDAPASELRAIPVPGDGYEIVVGQKALAIGNPFGLDHTLTTGTISAIGRDRPGVGGVTIRDMIQTDASINMGNSGGPLLDSDGQLIGMNTMIYSTSGGSEGIGFAVPVSVIRRIVPQIIRTGKAQQIGLGISILPDSIARQNGIKGVIVRAVSSGSPADKAGLKGLEVGSSGAKLGDVIIGIDEQTVSNYDDLYNELDRHNPGDRVNVKIKRDGKVVSIPVEVYVLPY